MVKMSPIKTTLEIPFFRSLKSKYVEPLAKIIALGQQISPPSPVNGNKYIITCSVNSEKTKNKISMICRDIVIVSGLERNE